MLCLVSMFSWSFGWKIEHCKPKKGVFVLIVILPCDFPAEFHKLFFECLAHVRLTLSASKLNRNVAQFPQNTVKFWSDFSAKYVRDFLEHIHHSFNIFFNVFLELFIVHYTLVINLVKNMHFLNFRQYFWNFLAFRIQIMFDVKLAWISFSEL